MTPKLRTDNPLTVRRADYEEQREGNHLLVWRDLPCWMIVDHDLRSLVNFVDGRRNADELAGRDRRSSRRSGCWAWSRT